MSIANTSAPQATLAVGQELGGFIVRCVTPSPEIRSTVYQIDHPASGARIVHISNSDDENLFSVSCKTPPHDDTGLPHILEHSVLAGSRSYPVREPFFEMFKLSMATFLNAMTGYDATYYPVASNVRRDLFNLAEVYFDAVFHPLLTSSTFLREAHHFEPADKKNPTGPLTISGIVYNEMKSYFSDPEGKLHRMGVRRLLPDTVYGKESGGDPDFIPDLTHQGLIDFHKKCYHPSNALFILYGNIPTTDYLDFLRPRLAEFQKQPAVQGWSRQRRWTEPKLIEDSYPIGADEPSAERTYLSMQWIVGDSNDPVSSILWHILGLVLSGNEAAPLKTALVASGLGQDVMFAGSSDAGWEQLFHVGIKGGEADRREKFERLVLSTLKTICEGPIDPKLVTAAFQQAGYYFLEVLPNYPLHLMHRTMEGWLYSDDPLKFMPMRQHLAAAKKRYEADPMVFNTMIRCALLENPHRLSIVLRPDSHLQKHQDELFAAKMNEVHRGLTRNDLLKIAEQAKELERKAGEPNPPAELAKLPHLEISDLPEAPRRIPTRMSKIAGVDFLRNELFSNGVSYLQLDLDISRLPDDLWAYVPRYADAFRKMGAAGKDYRSLAQLKTLHTGGIGVGPTMGTFYSAPDQPVWGMRMSLKALDENIDPALDLLHDLLFGVDPSDRARLRDVVVQARAFYRTDLPQNGSSTASRLAMSFFSPQRRLDEIMDGLPQLAICDRLVGQFDRAVEMLIQKIQAIRDFLIHNSRLTVSFTGGDAASKRVEAAVAAWVKKMPGALKDRAARMKPIEKLDVMPRLGLAAPSRIAHSTMAMPAPHAGEAVEPLVVIGRDMLVQNYLLPEIRFRGNAYGARASYDSFAGTFTMGSYADPHIQRTIDVMNGALDFVKNAHWTQTDVDRGIISSAKGDAKPIRPGEATGQALGRLLSGITQEVRQARFERLKQATPAKVKEALLSVLEPGLKNPALCVASSREKLEAANREMSQKLDIRDVLAS